MNDKKKLAVITGANRGLGLETSHQLAGLSNLADGSPSGLFWRDRQPIAW
jgi:NAD(P)-dependent dehydrogenase (short-subunit alcohol dehydrogenase family)